MVLYWQDRWQEGVRAVKGWLIAGIAVGLTAVVLLHDTNLIHKATKHALPMERDPLHRVRAWSEIARVAGAAREQLAAGGRPAFIITGHYGLVGEITFYLPAARAVVKDQPLVYFRSADRPQNQYYFWPSYREQRRGEDAIFIQELDRPTMNFKQTLQAFLTGEVDPTPPPGEAPPDELLKEFRSVTNLGVTPIAYRGQAFRWVQLFVCRELQ